MNNGILEINSIQGQIYMIRGLQVMLDRDLAVFYNIETRLLNQAVKRNIERFPPEFCFQLTVDEFNYWKSQIVMSNNDKMGLRRSPYAFTEQGVAMLSAVLKSETAVKISVQIMNAFVAMRRFLLSNAQVFQRLDTLELKQIKTDRKMDDILSAIENKSIKPRQGIFYDGQVFDAWQFVSGLVRSAKKTIILIDNYVDDTVLALFVKRKKGVSVTILTRNIPKQSGTDVKKFNEQYEPIEMKEFMSSHDRFIIIDGKELYHFGASLKDLGKKWFAFSKMDMEATRMLENLKKMKLV